MGKKSFEVDFSAFLVAVFLHDYSCAAMKELSLSSHVLCS